MKDGKYWDKPWSLIDGCAPCSPGCEHCWSAAMAHRFARCKGIRNGEPIITNAKGQFKGVVIPRVDRLSIPLKRRKPTVYAVWNDLFHEAVPDEFRSDAIRVSVQTPWHTYLALTKRPHVFLKFMNANPVWYQNWWSGLTICNQAEADEKIPVFLQVPGQKFLSIEPMLGPVNIKKGLPPTGSAKAWAMECGEQSAINAVILGGETGPGARPLHPDWVRSVRDQCAAAGVPFFLKCNGEFLHESQFGQHIPSLRLLSRKTKYHQWPDGTRSYKIGKERANRLFDGRTHDDLPWRRGNDTAEI